MNEKMTVPGLKILNQGRWFQLLVLWSLSYRQPPASRIHCNILFYIYIVTHPTATHYVPSNIEKMENSLHQPCWVVLVTTNTFRASCLAVTKCRFGGMRRCRGGYKPTVAGNLASSPNPGFLTWASMQHSGYWSITTAQALTNSITFFCSEHSFIWRKDAQSTGSLVSNH